MKPVAWINEEMQVMFLKELADAYPTLWKPLYTHPVKEQDTDCQYCKQGCIRCDARKQLTDEEITDIWLDVFSNNSTAERQLIFARAILRKASEK